MPITFKSAKHEEIYNNVKGWMVQMFGETASMREDAPTFGVRTGSAWVAVNVYAWGDDDAVISVRSWVVTGPEIKEDLLRYLLQENMDMRFGAFGVDKEGDIAFEHAIRGQTASKEELRSSIRAVSYVADKYDDEIVGRWGGQRACDRT